MPRPSSARAHERFDRNLTTEGELFCGDLMDGMGKPSLEFFIDDMAAAEASLGGLRRLGVGMVCPGHGKPFRLVRVAANR